MCMSGVLIALSACEVPQTTFDQSDPTPLYQVTLEAVDGEGIRGWAWNANDPDQPVEVTIYDGNEVIGRVMADGFRQDLADAGKGNGRHAFHMPVPARICDGEEHLIHAQVEGVPPPLHIPPRSFTCARDGFSSAKP